MDCRVNKMGMFDWVDYKIDCPDCGEEITGFQSKDNVCHLLMLRIDEVRDFYAACDYCGLWLDMVSVPVAVDVLIKGIERKNGQPYETHWENPRSSEWEVAE